MLPKATRKSKMKIALFILMIMLLTVGSFPFDLLLNKATAATAVPASEYYYPSPPTITKPDEHSLRLGAVNGDKVVENSTPVYIERLDNPVEGYGPILTNVHVERISVSGASTEVTGKAIAFANLSKNADAGYVFVDTVEVVDWIKVLNGNPNYVLSHIYPYQIKTLYSRDLIYQAYNLAEVAEACGGQGVTIGDGLVSSGSGYIKHDHYKATPRPTASVSTNKKLYKTNESVTVTATGTDYSIWNKGIVSVNLALYKKVDRSEYRSVQATTSLVWPSPLKSGDYEVSYVMTDNHGRTTQNSTDVGISTPVLNDFQVEVGICTPVSTTLKISGSSDKVLSSGGTYTMPSGKNTITLAFPASGTLTIGSSTLTGSTFSNILIDGIKVFDFKSNDETLCGTYTVNPSPDSGAGDPGTCDYTIHVSTYTSTGNGEINMDMPSDSDGPAVSLNTKTDYLQLTSDITGTFFIGNTKLNQSPGKSASLTTFSTDVFTLRFESSDGTECWTKKFYLDKPTGEVKCPEITRNNSVISNGDVIKDIPLNGSLVLTSTYLDENRNIQTAMLKWRVKRPDGTTTDFMWTDGDDDTRGWRLIEWHEIKIPYDPRGWPADKQLKFDLPGTYEISYYYDPAKAPWGENHCPPWSITVEVSACTDLSIRAELNGSVQYMDGDGTQGNEYIVKLPDTMPVTAKFTLRYQQYNTSYMGNWVLKRTNDAIPIATGNSQNPFSYVFTDGGSYILTVRTVVGGVTCEKTILISGTTCEGMAVEGFVDDRPVQRTGSGTGDDPYVITIKGGKNNNLELKVKNGSKDVHADWTLKRGGTSIYNTSTNSFTYKLLDSPEIYTLAIKIDLNGTTCYKYVRFQTDGVPSFTCDQITIDGIVNGAPLRSSGNGTAGSPYVVTVIEGQINDVSIGLELPDSDASVSAEWTLKRGNATIKTDSGYSFQYQLPNSNETYTLVAQVKNKNDYCYVYIRFEPGSFTCNEVYLHFSDNKQNYFNVAPAPGHTGTKTIKGNKLDRMILLVGTRPDTVFDAQIIEAKFEGPLPNQGTFDPDQLYERFNIPAGTYPFKITINDPAYPVLNGCSFTFTLVIDPDASPEPDPGGGQDGGKLKINIYDSTNRLLRSTSDGVWEREPARIEVMIDQAKIDSAFQQIDREIQKAIDEKKEEYLDMYPPPDYEDVQVTPSPPTWNSKTNSATKWPASLTLTVNGPGTNQSLLLNPKLPTQSNTYTGTLTPTQTTWLANLQSQKYQVKVDSFTIEVPYTVQFAVSYQKCEMKSAGEDPDTGEPLPEEKVCSPGADSGTLANNFSITVQGDQTQFEVFEPNAKGSLQHTAEWSEYHARDRYPLSKGNDFYAGERIVTRVQLEERHRHPFSGQYPTILSSQAWISETGKRNTPLQSLLSLQAFTSSVWGGPSQTIAKLGRREVGVDTSLMGDKQRGFQKGSSYLVYYRVQFAYGVDKGFAYLNKTGLLGHNPQDYLVPFSVIANAWERQGIRNHTSH